MGIFVIRLSLSVSILMCVGVFILICKILGSPAEYSFEVTIR